MGVFSARDSFSSFSSFWMTYRRPEQYVLLSVKACEQALILLSQDLGNTYSNTTIIEIGGDNNEEIFFLDGVNGRNTHLTEDLKASA